LFVTRRNGGPRRQRLLPAGRNTVRSSASAGPPWRSSQKTSRARGSIFEPAKMCQRYAGVDSRPAPRHPQFVPDKPPATAFQEEWASGATCAVAHPRLPKVTVVDNHLTTILFGQILRRT